MTTRRRAGALLASGAVLLAGCASTHAATVNRSTGPSSVSAGGSTTAPGTMTPGMVMPDGSTMGASAPAQNVADAGPSAAARMICSAEIRTDITQVLGLKTLPAPTARWSKHVYTCTYRLPMGTFVLTVTESPNAAAARIFAAGLRSALPQSRSVAGLTTTSFATPQGLVALVKDNDTLQVDASRLPSKFGSQQEKRTDFAYEIASDILGCWTGD